MLKIKRALISVSDKTGVVEFGRLLDSFGIEVLSTGGTAKALRAGGCPAIEISDYTGFPEMLDGRVKTLHPKIHGGLLALRDNAAHVRTVREHGIGYIDMVVVNLYPFERTVAKPGVTLEEAIENIDIGGPSMLRSAAKNYRSVAVVCDPAFYPRIERELREHDGALSPALLEELAGLVFRRTASYDGAIADFLAKRFPRPSLPAPPREGLPERLALALRRVAPLRYGENPHQKAAVYAAEGQDGLSLVEAQQLGGKELSFNNYLDLDAAFAVVAEHAAPAACIIKHTNPTGVAAAPTLVRAFRDALATDPLSAFGGIIGVNRAVDEATARAILRSGFMECVIAPGFAKGALALLAEKKNLRLLALPGAAGAGDGGLDVKGIRGGFVVQERDAADAPPSAWRAVTRKKPTKAQLASLAFAWRVVKQVKSNAIVLARGTKTVGIGMGQTSRVDSVFMALRRAGKERAAGAVLASDAFFPNEDNIALAKKAGIAAIVEPGGSVADERVIAACDKAGIAMVFTGMRHFKH